ncbi:M23 family metallopeptidase, partial [Nocardioides litoris]|uniref:M23 family metallopeptidase n=1 Tax=Nocardioides litoris TaxID=1926648 RepID=UPI0011225F20
MPMMKHKNSLGVESRSRRVAALAGAALLACLVIPFTSAPATAAPAFHLPFDCGSTWKATTYDTGKNVRSGKTWSHRNYLDFGQAGASGKPVRASAAGYARLVSAAEGKVSIDHGGGWSTLYQHMSSVNVTAGGRNVNAGDVIGAVGNAGANSTGAHLHYAQLSGGQPQTPSFTGGQYTWSSPRTYTSGGITFTNDRYSTNSLTSQNCGRPPAPTAP